MKSAIAKGCALTAVALGTFLTTHAASAAVPGDNDVRSVVVQYRDLDLSRPTDARRLYGRITRAARRACDNYPDSELALLAIYKSCMRKAITNAVAEVKSPQLTTVYQTEIHRISRS